MEVELPVGLKINPFDIVIVHDLYVCSYCSTFYYYRQDAAKRQTAGIKFTHKSKIRVFALQGRLVAPIHVKLGMADGHLGPLGCAIFHLNRLRGVGMRPQNIKNFNFFAKCRLAGTNPLTNF